MHGTIKLKSRSNSRGPSDLGCFFLHHHHRTQGAGRRSGHLGPYIKGRRAQGAGQTLDRATIQGRRAQVLEPRTLNIQHFSPVKQKYITGRGLVEQEKTRAITSVMPQMPRDLRLVNRNSVIFYYFQFQPDRHTIKAQINIGHALTSAVLNPLVMGLFRQVLFQCSPQRSFCFWHLQPFSYHQRRQDIVCV